MDIRDIEAFIVVTQVHTVTAAAEKLHLTQPAVSKRLQRMEEEIGVALFERMGSKMLLTHAGEVFLKRAVSLLADLQEAVRETRIASHHPTYFSVGMVGTLAGTTFAERFGVFRQQHEQMEIRLRTARSDEIGEFVASGELDVGLRYFPDKKAKNVTQVQVGEERFVIISSARFHPRSKQVHETAIAGQSWVAFTREGTSGSPFTEVLDSLLLLHGVPEGERIQVDSLTALKRLVEAGFGLGFVPESSIVEERNLGTLKIINEPKFEASAPIYALFRDRSAVIPIIETFIMMMRDR